MAAHGSLVKNNPTHSSASQMEFALPALSFCVAEEEQHQAIKHVSDTGFMQTFWSQESACQELSHTGRAAPAPGSQVAALQSGGVGREPLYVPGNEAVGYL